MVFIKGHDGSANAEYKKKQREKRIGEKHGTLTIISIGIKKNVYTYNCKCDCGQIKENVLYGILKDLKVFCQYCKKKKQKEDFYSDDKVRKRILESIKICENGCWEWQKRLSWNGYGQIKYRQTSHPAHRISYKVFKKEIPKGLCACHTCDNPKCVNPDHLWIGSHKENAQDRSNKNRSNHYEKRQMKVDDVIEIRKMYPEKTIKELSVKYGVSVHCIRDIVTRKTWK